MPLNRDPSGNPLMRGSTKWLEPTPARRGLELNALADRYQPRPNGFTELSGPPHPEQRSMADSAPKLKPLAICGRDLKGCSRVAPQREQEHATAVKSWVGTRNGSMTECLLECRDLELAGQPSDDCTVLYKGQRLSPHSVRL
jgi:hypothetical protein